MQEWPTNPTSPFWRYGERRTPGLRDYFLAQVERAVIPNLRRLLDFSRVHRLRVIHTTIASELPDGDDWIPTLRRTNAVAREEIGEVVFPARTDRWARIVEPLTPRPDEVVINKTTYSAFTSSGLEVLLRNLRIETLVLGGIITNRCVETTAREATAARIIRLRAHDGRRVGAPEGRPPGEGVARMSTPAQTMKAHRSLESGQMLVRRTSHWSRLGPLGTAHRERSGRRKAATPIGGRMSRRGLSEPNQPFHLTPGLAPCGRSVLPHRARRRFSA